MIVADTDVLIDFLRGAGAAERVAAELERGLATTVISAFELWAGSVGSEKREAAVAKLLGALEIVNLEPASARRAAELRLEMKGQGRTLPMADSLIAGICVEKRATLLTRNTRHFDGVPHLALGEI